MSRSNLTSSLSLHDCVRNDGDIGPVVIFPSVFRVQVTDSADGISS